MSQQFGRTESRILSAPSKPDDFLLNPQVHACSGTVPATSLDSDLENWEPTGNRSQNDIHPEVEFSTYRTSNSADSDQVETYHKFITDFCRHKTSIFKATRIKNSDRNRQPIIFSNHLVFGKLSYYPSIQLHQIGEYKYEEPKNW